MTASCLHTHLHIAQLLAMHFIDPSLWFKTFQLNRELLSVVRIRKFSSVMEMLFG